MSQPPLDDAASHRRLAVEFSDRAWQLAEKASRTVAETDEMLHAAQAAAMHWQAVGASLEAQRAENILTVAYLKADQSEAALHHARQALAMGDQNADDRSPLDRATTLAASAKAHNLAGNGGEALRLITLAVEEADKLSDEERARFDRLFGET